MPDPGCGQPMTRVGKDISEKLDVVPVVPGEFFVHRNVYGKWACRCCQRLVQEAVEPQIIDGGMPAPGLLAHTLISRICRITARRPSTHALACIRTLDVGDLVRPRRRCLGTAACSAQALRALVRHVAGLVARVSVFEPPRNLLRRPLQLELVRHDVCQGYPPACSAWAEGRAPRLPGRPGSLDSILDHRCA